MPELDAPYLDPSRGRRDAPTRSSTGLRLIGTALLLIGFTLGCLGAWQWLRTGTGHSTVISDIVFHRLPDPVRDWIAQPHTWHGLHRFIVWMLDVPLFASAAFAGFLLLLASTGSGRRERETPEIYRFP